MSEKNLHVTEFLNYYIGLNNPPEYAVLLQGTWGVGKSWYIKKYVDNYPHTEFLKISLYGITSYKEIENAFFELLHPVLSSKTAKLTGKILSGLLKTTLRIDIDGKAGSSDISTNILIPDFINEFDKKAVNSVLIFDDLERCSIKTEDLLGYINQYVENYGLKVILLANEEELKKKDHLDGNRTSYLNIKEKLIGKTFVIEADLNSALDFFILQVRRDDLKAVLKSNKHLLEGAYKIGNYQNLRHLKQSIMDFDRFYDFLPKDLHMKTGLLEHIICEFFALAIEIKKGEIIPDEIHEIFLRSYLAHDEVKEETRTQIIIKKYPVFGIYQHPLNWTFYTTFFKSGKLDPKSVDESIKNSVFYSEERKPLWLKLHRFFEMEDEDFKNKLGELWHSLEKDEIKDKYDFLHIVALLFHFSENGLLAKTDEEIKVLANKAIVSLEACEALLLERGEEINPENAKGVGFFNCTNADFREIFEKLKKTIEKVEDINLPKKANALLALLKQKRDSDFIVRLTLSNSEDNIYFETAILHKIDPDEFTKAYLSLTNERKRCFFESLETRYKNAPNLQKLKPEEEWWVEVSRCLNSRTEDYQQTVTGLLLDRTAVTISRIIDQLKKVS